MRQFPSELYSTLFKDSQKGEFSEQMFGASAQKTVKTCPLTRWREEATLSNNTGTELHGKRVCPHLSALLTVGKSRAEKSLTPFKKTGSEDQALHQGEPDYSGLCWKLSTSHKWLLAW